MRRFLISFGISKILAFSGRCSILALVTFHGVVGFVFFELSMPSLILKSTFFLYPRSVAFNFATHNPFFEIDFVPGRAHIIEYEPT